METSAVHVRSESHGELLLPGIPDDITLCGICAKLPWTNFYNLSLVSHAWLHAIRNRRVYNARVRSQSTETHVLVNYIRPDSVHVIGLFSIRDGFLHDLPPFPYLDGQGIPQSCRCVSLDGQVYVMGGETESDNHAQSPTITNKVYMIDMAGKKQWTERASMNQRRKLFGCGVLAGKIYVFGGILACHHFDGCEVYDPVENEWSSIARMTTFRLGVTVEVVGEDLLLIGGIVVDPEFYSKRGMMNLASLIKPAAFIDLYHPVRDEWRRVKAFLDIDDSPFYSDFIFFANGKFYYIRWPSLDGADLGDICVHDVEQGVWTDLHSFSLAGLGGVGPSRRHPIGIRVINGELLVRVDVRVHDQPQRTYVIKFEGIGGAARRIVWQQKAQFPISGNVRRSTIYFMCPIQL